MRSLGISWEAGKNCFTALIVDNTQDLSCYCMLRPAHLLGILIYKQGSPAGSLMSRALSAVPASVCISQVNLRY